MGKHLLSIPQTLLDLMALLTSHDWPREIRLPRGSWVTVCRHFSYSDLREDALGCYFWFHGTKVRPPAPGFDGLVDLSGTPEED